MNRHERRKLEAEERRLRRGVGSDAKALSATIAYGELAETTRTTAAAANAIPATYRGQVIGIPVHPMVKGLATQTPEILSLYVSTFKAAIDEAIKTQGAAAFEATKRQAAIHEAGHIVIYPTTGTEADWSMIWSSMAPTVMSPVPVPRWGGWTEAHFTEPTMKDFGSVVPFEFNVRNVKNIMAGYIAEDVIEPELSREGSSLDERVGATVLCAAVSAWAGGRTGADAMALLQKTQQEVGEHLIRNKARVLAMADALMAAYPKKLGGAEIARILAA